MGSHNNGSSGQSNTGAGVQIKNDKSAEISAGTTPVGGAGGGSNSVTIPAPVVTMSVSDPDALDNVKARAKQEAARRGRKSLRIPLTTGAAAGSGIAIPV